MYIAPLRHAVLVLGRKAKPWTVASMSSLGQAQDYAARAYAHRLANAGVLVWRPDGLYQTGPRFGEWEKRKPKTRPGGHRLVSYKAIPVKSI